MLYAAQVGQAFVPAPQRTGLEACLYLSRTRYTKWRNALVKQIFDLENVRAMSFTGIRRLTLFAYLAYGFLCLFAKRIGKDGIRAIRKLYKSFGETPHFLYYRLAPAVSLALLRAGP